MGHLELPMLLRSGMTLKDGLELLADLRWETLWETISQLDYALNG